MTQELMFLPDLIFNQHPIEMKGPTKKQLHLESIEGTIGQPIEETQDKARVRLSMEFLPENLAWIIQTNKSSISVSTANVSVFARNASFMANISNMM